MYLGRRLAELELLLLLTKVLPKYRLSTEVEDIKMRNEIVLMPDVPLHINFKRR